METINEFLHELDAVVRTLDETQVVPKVMQLLSELGAADPEIPQNIKGLREDRYARYCLALPDDKAFSVILMAWAPNQGGNIHDHGNLWCVECVLDGKLAITQYNPEEVDEAGRVNFKELETIIAGKGETGHLIPPLEYHKVKNASSTEPAYSIHVYGGEMKQCTQFIQDADGYYQREYMYYQIDNGILSPTTKEMQQ